MGERAMKTCAAGELLATFMRLSTASPFLCEDCEQPTDLGAKCSACYRVWQTLLWQDVPRERRRLMKTCEQLNAHPLKREIAIHATTGKGPAISEEGAELLAEVKLCLDGPFEPSMRVLVNAIASKKSATVAPREPAKKLREALS